MSTGIDTSNLPDAMVSGVLPGARMMRKLRFLESSARVRRWHTEPVLHTQSVGEHTYTVMQLIWMLSNERASRNLLVAAMLHDTAERKFGDVPGPTKRMLNLKDTFDALENDFLSEVGIAIPELTSDEQNMLKLADALEGGLFCAFELRRGNREIREGFYNYLCYIAERQHNALSSWIFNQLRKEYTDVFGE